MPSVNNALTVGLCSLCISKVFGSKGTEGNNGTQGTTGSQGTQGTQGTQASQGIQGGTGVQGADGVGAQGTAGAAASRRAAANVITIDDDDENDDDVQIVEPSPTRSSPRTNRHRGNNNARQPAMAVSRRAFFDYFSSGRGKGNRC